MMYLFLVELTGAISDFMYSYLLIILLLAVGVYFSFRTGLVQIRMLKEAICVVTEKKEGNNSVSAFEALMVSTASRVGTGNIVGVANAIAIGGYGAVHPAGVPGDQGHPGEILPHNDGAGA